MHNDTIVDETHAVRSQLLSQHGDGFATYFATVLKKQEEHPECYVSFVQAAAVASPLARSLTCGLNRWLQVRLALRKPIYMAQ